MCVAVSAGDRFRKEQASSSPRTRCDSAGRTTASPGKKGQTSQPVNGPLFELLEGYIGRRRIGVEVQTVWVFSVLVLRRRELFLAMVDNIASFRIDPVVILAQHLERFCYRKDEDQTQELSMIGTSKPWETTSVVTVKIGRGDAT
jgi:hypothetical protein